MQVTRAAFDAELTEVLDDLAGMGRLAGQLMINASAALLQADLVLADLVIARAAEIGIQYHEAEQRCLTRLAPCAPVAVELCTVVAALRVARDLRRMGHLAQHTAQLAQRTHPNLTVLPDEVRTVIAQLSLLAGGLAQQAVAALENLDPLCGDRLARAAGELAALRRRLFGIVFAEGWSYGSESAAHAGLIGRHYERFSACAVAVAKQVCHLITGRAQGPPLPVGQFSDPLPRQEHQHPRPIALRRCVPRSSGSR
ncbi:MAG TPA: PhoU domain-containing protein [Pseudonocardiaceae bacterium]|nr:PhoU domain-containing protein [Pseudonocardiaceae bacterium]